ncbi:MAG: 16S rRNA (guanine(527)-N(7))-methyltransferase RsmG [Alphaproteobacteria bacterium]|nr:16S rRNA (guanine(527)-N(7))-methyltransferase RsmG [Alphaproteobacteria bacterium]
MSDPVWDEDGFGPRDVQPQTGATREALDLIQRYIEMLDVWRTRLNLIGPSERRHIWRRHVLDSIQLLNLLDAGEENIADLGAGAGFPGIILACALKGRGRANISLVEKSPRKAEFLATVVSELGLPAAILNGRIEEPAFPPAPVDLVTARAVAPLSRLLGYAEPWLKPGGRCLFLKGREATTELTLARESWTFGLSVRASASSPDGQVLAISSLRRRT